MKSLFTNNIQNLQNESGFTPTPKLGVIPCVSFKIQQFIKSLTFSGNSLSKSRRHKNTMPSLVSGFTIVETLVSIFIIVTVVTGVFSAVQIGFSTTNTAKNQIKAFYLTQEVAEIIRHKRDGNNILSLQGTPTNWLSGIANVSGDPCYPGTTCIAEASDMSLTSCIGVGWGICDPLRQHSTSYLYGYNSGWDQTKFTREVQIEKISDDEIIASIRIFWTQGVAQKEFKVRIHFFNWL